MQKSFQPRRFPFFLLERRVSPWLIGLLLTCAGLSLWCVPAHGQIASATENVVELPGISIVEKIQGAIRRCAGAPCAIFVPAGTYDASPISNWKDVDETGSRVGVLLPSNIEIRGAGEGLTTIRVTRSALDPAATLFANAKSSNAGARRHDIHIRHMSLMWTDSSTKYDWVSILLCRACDRLELDHVRLEGNPNKLVNLLDNTGLDIHDSSFVLNSTSYGHGDNALSVSHFDTAASLEGNAGIIRDNRFTQTGDFRTFSMLIVAQSGLYVHDNTFEAYLPLPGYATAIESGEDNLARLPDHVNISGNFFHGSSIAYGGLNDSEISGNFFDHGDIYIAAQSGTTSTLSSLTIADNELHFGSIYIAGLEHTSTSRCIITRNRVFDGNIGTGNSSLVHDIEVTYNSVRYSANKSGIECNACSVIVGNVVREVGQSSGNLQAGYLIAGAVSNVSDNIYLDEQHDYGIGTVCSVDKPSSLTCLSSGRSRWILLHDGTWAPDWTNRLLFMERGNLLIRSFASNSVLELEEDSPDLPSRTPYHLSRTTFNAFELNGAVIERFANNLAVSANGAFHHAAVQEDGTVLIHNLSGNVFRPYSCTGKCAVDYRSTFTTP